MRTLLLVSLSLSLSLSLSSASCVPAAIEEEGALIDTRDNVLEQGIVDCTESSDTGYSQGNAFAITVVTIDGKPIEVDTGNAYAVMQQAAAADGVNIRIVSGFRTMAQQQYLYGCYVNCNCNNCNLAASPGYSNHQSGHALDLNTSDAGVLSWLNAHGGGYGFARTVPSEAWHWEWWGGGPGGGPCGADPECIFNPNYGGCAGSVVTRCDENLHVATGDCAFYGAACSVEGGAPHCVHPYCPMNLDGAESGSFCLDATRVASCDLGAYSEGDCGSFGCTCSDEGGSGHCVHPYCPANLDGAETGTFCVDGTEKIATCNLGQYSEGDCAAYGATCSEAGVGAHCVHFLCWSNLDGAEDGAFCKDTATLATCALGAYTEAPCVGGCSEGRCNDARCTAFDGATGASCADDVLATCTAGLYAETDCPAGCAPSGDACNEEDDGSVLGAAAGAQASDASDDGEPAFESSVSAGCTSFGGAPLLFSLLALFRRRLFRRTGR